MKPKFFFVLFFPLFVGFSIFEGISSYEWDSKNLPKNVHTFAKFMDDLYEDYKIKGKMDIHWLNQSKLYTEKGFKQKRTVFNLTFVKCAAEIAHFRVLNKNDDSKDAYLNLKLVTISEIILAKNEFIGFLNFDQTLGQQIAKKFKDEIFSQEKRNPKVVHQILQLAFSFAVRVILSIVYASYFNERNDIGGWQLKTLLTAYKELSKKSGISDENGIFPFKIIQIDENRGEAVHFWAQKFEEDDYEQMIADEEDNYEKYKIEQKKIREKKQQQKYIGNFKFILELSDFTLSQYEISKLLQAIKNRPKKREKLKAIGHIQNENQPEIYKKMENYFAKSLATKRMNCAFLNFGRALAKRLKFEHEKFTKLANEHKKECGEDPHKVYEDRQNPFISVDNTPADGNQIEMELFNEPLWNYVRVFGIDANEAMDVFKFCKDLHTVVQKKMEEPKISVFDKMNLQVTNVTTEMKEFKNLNSILKLVEDMQNSDQLDTFSSNYKGKNLSQKKDALKELLEILLKIRTDYSNASKREISKNGIRLTHYGNIILRFEQILYETVQNLENLPKDRVKYNENEQLLTIPISFAKDLLKRLYEFLERNLKENNKISDDFDFVQTLQTVAKESMELEAEKRQNSIKAKDNVNLFQLLFSLAIRLCFLIDEKEKLAKKYLPKFVFALKMCQTENGYNNFELFKHKMKFDAKNVQINFRNWNLPYFVYKENEDEFKMEKAEVEENIGKLEGLMKLIKPKDEKDMVENILQNLKQLHQSQEKKQKLKDEKDKKGIRKLKDEDDQVKMMRAKLLGIS